MIPNGQPLPQPRINDLMGIYGSIKQLAGIPTSDQLASMNSSMTEAIKKRGINGYRPPEWGKLYGSEQTIRSEDSDTVFMSFKFMDGTEQFYFFDAVISTEHSTRRQVTEHPVQWRAAISDHSYQIPASVTLEIGMSDVMDNPIANTTSFYTFSPSKSGKGKSVNAYQAFVALQKTGSPLTLNTRLNRYSNMIIESLTTRDDHKTTHGLKCTITFKEIFIAKTGKAQKSLYPADTIPVTRSTVNTSKREFQPSIAYELAGGNVFPTTVFKVQQF